MFVTIDNAFQVGGIKDKLLAAHRAGLTTVIIPAANKKDLADIPNSILVNTIQRKQSLFVLYSHILIHYSHHV